MKKIILFLPILIISISAFSQNCSQLFFSEYCEGGGNNKYLEIYNPTCGEVNLTGYVVKKYINGAITGTNVKSISLLGKISPQGTFILANPNSVSAILAAVTINGMTHYEITFNGDDALVLFSPSGDTLDVIGVIGNDPGSYWGTSPDDTKDNTLVRKAAVTIGDTSNPNTFNPSVGWTSLGKDVFTDIQSHTGSCPLVSNDGGVITTSDPTSICLGGMDDTVQITITGNIGDSSQIVVTDTNGKILGLPNSNTIDLSGAVAGVCQIWHLSYTTGLSGLNVGDTISNLQGCFDFSDSISVTRFDYARDTTTDTICQGGSLTFKGKTYDSTGIYMDTVSNGCDTIYVLDLLESDYARDTTTDTICQGGSLTFKGKTYDSTGIYMDTVSNGCDTIYVLDLLESDYARDTIFDTICFGDTTMYAGNKIATADVYFDTTYNGCDSIHALSLSITKNTKNDTITLCPGESYTVGSNIYTTAGTYYDTLPSVGGCDTIVVTKITYYSVFIGSINYSVCLGDSVQVLGKWYYTDSVFYDTVSGIAYTGCDSITRYTVVTKTVKPALNLGNDIVSCLGGGVTIIASTAYDTYSWSNGNTTNTITVNGSTSGVGSTDYILTVTQASSGCSSTDTVNITFNDCAGLNEKDIDLNVNLYPNPASNFLNIDIYDKYNQGDLRLVVMNTMGQIIEDRMIENNTEKVVVDLNNYTNGLYFVRISSDRVYMSKKVIIRK